MLHTKQVEADLRLDVNTARADFAYQGQDSSCSRSIVSKNLQESLVYITGLRVVSITVPSVIQYLFEI